jgi:hypothetical protein
MLVLSIASSECYKSYKLESRKSLFHVLIRHGVKVGVDQNKHFYVIYFENKITLIYVNASRYIYISALVSHSEISMKYLL